MSYVELHFHLLPGVDDGPASIDESVALARAAVADGTRTVVATPHVHPQHIVDPGEIPARVAEISERLRRERIALTVLPGGELAHDMVGRLTGRELETIAHGPPGRRWLLLESPFHGLDGRFTAAADELRERGFAVLVAHPERSEQPRSPAGALAHEFAAGSAFQLTAGSLTGNYGQAARALALTLLKSSNRAVIASDAHSVARMPMLRLALDALAAAGECDLTRFVSAIPHAMLEQGLRIPPALRAA